MTSHTALTISPGIGQSSILPSVLSYSLLGWQALISSSWSRLNYETFPILIFGVSIPSTYHYPRTKNKVFRNSRWTLLAAMFFQMN